jgi:hypothetical protein
MANGAAMRGQRVSELEMTREKYCFYNIISVGQLDNNFEQLRNLLRDARRCPRR